MDLTGRTSGSIRTRVASEDARWRSSSVPAPAGQAAEPHLKGQKRPQAVGATSLPSQVGFAEPAHVTLVDVRPEAGVGPEEEISQVISELAAEPGAERHAEAHLAARWISGGTGREGPAQDHLVGPRRSLSGRGAPRRTR